MKIIILIAQGFQISQVETKSRNIITLDSITQIPSIAIVHENCFLDFYKITSYTLYFFIQELSNQHDLLQQIASSLVSAGLYEKAGDLYSQARSFQQAMEAYRAGCAFRRAIELARTAYPAEVVGLEEQWGDHLTSQKQFNAAITHFIEAGYVSEIILPV